jgi:chromosome segregation ATPase
VSSEIDRLRRLWEATHAELWERDKLVISQQAEIDRLQKANKHLKETFLAQSELIASKSFEIEQLKRDMQQAAKLNMELMQIRSENENEINGLHELLLELLTFDVFDYRDEKEMELLSRISEVLDEYRR